MIRRPPRSTPFPTRRSSDLKAPPDQRNGRFPGAEARHSGDAREFFGDALQGLLDFFGGDLQIQFPPAGRFAHLHLDRKSTRLNSSHGYISYAVFCLKKKKTT